MPGEACVQRAGGGWGWAGAGWAGGVVVVWWWWCGAVLYLTRTLGHFSRKYPPGNVCLPKVSYSIQYRVLVFVSINHIRKEIYFYIYYGFNSASRLDH